jgi:hypothetical protein
MSYSSDSSFLLPTEMDYYVAAAQVDRQITSSDGGIAWFLHNQEVRLRSSSKNVTRLVTTADNYGKKLEPRDANNDERLLDPRRQMSAAMRMGAVAGILAVEPLHRKALYNRDVLHHLPIPLTLQELDPEELQAALIEMGESGLELLGGQAKSIIDRWTNSVDVNTERRQVFSGMLGVVALGAHHAHVAHNLAFDQPNQDFKDFADSYREFDADAPEFDVELNEFLKDNSK